MKQRSTERRVVKIGGSQYLKCMEKKQLDKQTSDKVAFITFIIPEFASGYKMNMQDAYFYLKKYGGIDFLNKHWWALHTDNPFWAIRNMAKVCRNNGGYL